MKETCRQFHILGNLLFYASTIKKVRTGDPFAILKEKILIEIYNMQNFECIKTLTVSDFKDIDYDFQLVGSKLIVRSYTKLIFWDFMESGKEEIINIQAGNEEILKYKPDPENPLLYPGENVDCICLFLPVD